MEDHQQADRTEASEQRRRFILMLVSRAAVITALLGSTIFFNLRAGIPGFSTTQVLIYATVLAVYLLTAGYLVFLKVSRGIMRFGLHLQLNLLFDVVVATVLVYVSGGVESPFTFFFALPVVNTAVFYSRRGTFLTAGLASLFLGALFVLENQGIIPVDLEGRVRELPTAGRVVYLLALNYTVFFAIAWLAGYLGEQVRRAGRELKQKELDLETLTALTRDIVISLRSGLLVADPAGQVTLLNPVAEQILGLTTRDAMGRALTEVFPALAPVLGNGGGSDHHRLEVEYRRSGDDAIVPVGLTVSSLTNPDGEDAGLLVHMQDLTDRREMEASMKQAEKMATLGEMAAAMAHEIRNPLTSISGSVQMMQGSQGIGSEDRRLMEIILRETGRLDALLADFLAYARPQEPRLQDCSLKELIEDTVSVFLHRTENSGLAVQRDLDEVRVLVDPDQVRQVLWNLLTNATQAMEGRGTISVRLRMEPGASGGRRILLEVADEGPGVAEDVRGRIFEPFFTTRDKGNGLGLATVGRIVEAHGGTIRLHCPPEGGSRFSIELQGGPDE